MNLKLTKNLRLLSFDLFEETTELTDFANRIATIGDGEIGGPNDSEVVKHCLQLGCF